MLHKTLFVAASAAVLVPLAGGTAHASCLDDAFVNLGEGYTPTPKSEGYWPLYVHHSGTATVTVYGDALLGDYGSFATVDVPNYATAVSGNAPDATTTFVDCVAG